jgi:hypothetical protein
MELIILSIVGSLGTVLLHLLEFLIYPSGHAPSTVTCAQTRSAGAAELQTQPRAAAFHQRLQDQKRVTASARYAEQLLADRRATRSQLTRRMRARP